RPRARAPSRRLPSPSTRSRRATETPTSPFRSPSRHRATSSAGQSLTRRSLLLAAVLLAAEARARAGRAELVAAFADGPGGATGPGTYTRPGDSEIVDGDFDLRRFEVWLDGSDAVFKVTLGAPFRQPQVTARTTRTPLPLSNGIYLQNIDIYIDTDRASAAGYVVCIPGRRVRFTEGRTWKVAVVLTPQPGPARG